MHCKYGDWFCCKPKNLLSTMATGCYDMNINQMQARGVISRKKLFNQRARMLTPGNLFLSLLSGRFSIHFCWDLMTQWSSFALAGCPFYIWASALLAYKPIDAIYRNVLAKMSYSDLKILKETERHHIPWNHCSRLPTPPQLATPVRQWQRYGPWSLHPDRDQEGEQTGSHNEPIMKWTNHISQWTKYELTIN